MLAVYTINVNPAASNGSCASTGGVLNPSNEPTTKPCDPSKPAFCAIGDLAGKHCKMPGPNFATRYALSQHILTTMLISSSYIDPYLSTVVGSTAFVGNRSLVISMSNNVILCCADFSTNGGSSSPRPLVQSGPGPIVTAGSAITVVSTVSLATTVIMPASMGPGPVINSTDKDMPPVETPAAQPSSGA